jgi:Tol biopolymer transport system component
MTLGSSVVLSPDGRRLAYVTGDETERTLWVRSLGQLQGAALAGGANAETVYHPVFSPDGEWIAYVTPTELKKIPVSGGASITLCDVDLSRGAAWLPDDTIVVSPTGRDALSRVSANGGELQPLTTLNEAEKETSHRWPQALSDGSAVIFTVFTQAMASADEASIAIADMETGEHKVLHRGGYYGSYVPTGHLVYIHEGTLFAVPFDAEAREITGSAAPVVQGITASVGAGGAQYSFASDGTLVFISGELGVPEYPAVWVDRTGQTTKLWDIPASYANPRLSPDGKRLAFSILDGSNWDVWVYDLEREVATRLTFHDGYDADQIWTPDGEYLVFTSDRDGAANLYRKRADGSGEAEALTEGELQMYPISLSPDGNLALAEANAETIDIYVISLDGSTEPEPFLVTSFLERDPAFSSNGRWVAYASNESGRFQIYVRPYPAAGGRWQVSDESGRWPIWSRDGRELFYRTNEGVMVAEVETEGPTFRVGKARKLFEGRFRGGIQGISLAGFVFPDYDASADGQRFVMFPDEDDRLAKTQATFVFNWFDELQRTLPTTK